MGFKFRKRVSIIPGVKLNITSKGISSVSLGGKGATLNIGKKGTKATVGIPGSKMSYSKRIGNKKSKKSNQRVLLNSNYEIGGNLKRNVGFFLGIGILFMPFIFSWFLLRSGYSKFSRFIGFIWLALFIYSVSTGDAKF